MSESERYRSLERRGKLAVSAVFPAPVIAVFKSANMQKPHQFNHLGRLLVFDTRQPSRIKVAFATYQEPRSR